jgi:hypothetical protein
MTTLPPEVEKEGWRAYEQARAFEHLRRKRVPEIYAVFFVLLTIATFLVALYHPRSMMALGAFAVMVILCVLGWQKWLSLRMRHTVNLHLLEDWKARYGPDLPWLEVERHMVAVAELQAELKRGKAEDVGNG